MADLHTWLEATLRRISGKSDLAKAILYMLAQWTALTTVLRNGCITDYPINRIGDLAPWSLRPDSI